jgi:hypothetical protein
MRVPSFVAALLASAALSLGSAAFARGGHHGGHGMHHGGGHFGGGHYGVHPGGAYSGRGFGRGFSPYYGGLYPRPVLVRPTVHRWRYGRLGVGALGPAPTLFFQEVAPPAVCDEWTVDGTGMPCGGYQHVRGPIP